MQLGHSSGLTKEHVSGSYSLGRNSGMELMTYIFIQDHGRWCGYPKDHPDYHLYGESFEDLQLKLHELHLDPRRSTPSSVCSHATLLWWYWQRRTSQFRTEE